MEGSPKAIIIPEIGEMKCWYPLNSILKEGSFCFKPNGEIYVLANRTGTPFGDTGVILLITQVVPRGKGR